DLSCLEPDSDVGARVAVYARAGARRVVTRPQRLRDAQELEDVQRAGRNLVEKPYDVVAPGVDRSAQRRVGTIRLIEHVADLGEPRTLVGIGGFLQEQVDQRDGRPP